MRSLTALMSAILLLSAVHANERDDYRKITDFYRWAREIIVGTTLREQTVVIMVRDEWDRENVPVNYRHAIIQYAVCAYFEAELAHREGLNVEVLLHRGDEMLFGAAGWIPSRWGDDTYCSSVDVEIEKMLRRRFD